MRPKSKAAPSISADTFAEHLDAGGLIPEDPVRRQALCDALRAANGGPTLGPVADTVEIFFLDEPTRLADYLAEHSAWFNRP